MTASDNNNSDRAEFLALWRRTALAVAFIGAIFSIVILTLIVANYTQGRLRETRLEKKMENMKIELAAQSADQQALIDEIRFSDIEFRRSRLPRPNFTRIGGYLLLAALAVFALGIKLADSLKKKMPIPQTEQPGADQQINQAAMARWSVAGALTLAGAIVLFLVLSPFVDFSAKAVDVNNTGVTLADASYPTQQEISQNWHRFHGPQGAGVTADANIPDDWDGKSGRGILWKTPIPVSGNNSPIVWGDRVFLSGGDPNRLNVFCFDATSGKLLWTGDVTMTLPKAGDDEFDVMEDTGYASSTMATDGKRVYAIFVTGDLACFDFAGRNLWTKSLGIPDSTYGYASSLEVFRNMVIVQFDQSDAKSRISKLLAFDGASGRLVWETKRPVANSWSSPIVAKTESGFQIITAADPNVMAFDPNTGAEIWRAELLAGDVAASPIYAKGLAFFVEPSAKIAAIRTDGKGDVTKTHIAWSVDEPGPDICTPVTNGEYLFVLNSDGLALNFNITDGKKLWEADIREDFLASPSLVAGKLYLLTEKGVMIIAEPMPKYKELKRCELGESCHASPAFANGRIYIRGVENLYCIATDPALADASYPTQDEIRQNWHRFHGPEGAGVTADANIPDDWDGKSGRGIIWKTPVPVDGHNSPIVWGDRVFLSGGDPNKLNVFCFDAISGNLLWTGDVKRTLPKNEDEEFDVMEDTGYCASTMATDGKRVYAIFVTGDLACFDFAGRNLWTKSLGIPDSVYGYASSLEVFADTVIVQFDQGDADSRISKLLAFDGSSGRLVWEAKRPVANSWSSPIVAKTESGFQIITAADPNVMAFDPNTGAEIWRAELLAGDVAASPIYAKGLAFFVEPYSKIVAIRTDGKGDVTETHIAWSVDEPGPDICTPVTNGEYLFVLNSDGLALNFNAADGKMLWEEDIREDFLASPSLVAGKLYLLTEKGVMIIAEPMPKYKELKRCELGEKCHATPAFANGRIYIRGLENLYCIGTKP